jgi:spore maturation protein CgeB
VKVLCVFWQYQYGDKERGVGIEFESFITALKKLGHDVRHFETWDQTLYPTYADLNYALLAEVDAYHPDIVFTVQRDYEIWIETLEAIQRRGEASLITWTTDDSFKFDMVSKHIGRYYDAISTTYDYRVSDYRNVGIQGVYSTQWAANSHWLNPPKSACDCRYPVSFIGASYGARATIVEKLKSAGIHVECFGHGWPNGSISTHQIPVVMHDSVISLNFSAGFMCDAGNEKQVKARTFEVPGAGGFLLTDAAPGMDDLYRIGEEIETYSDFDDLVKKIRYYLGNQDERDKIARAGYLRTVTQHTYERRLEGMLRFGLDRRSARVQGDNRRTLVHQPSLKSTVPSNSMGSTLRLVRWLLIRGCTLVWGAKRGPKAARRLIFEASRRILGARTFGAKSLPGRMFPYV